MLTVAMHHLIATILVAALMLRGVSAPTLPTGVLYSGTPIVALVNAETSHHHEASDSHHGAGDHQHRFDHHASDHDEHHDGKTPEHVHVSAVDATHAQLREGGLPVHRALLACVALVLTPTLDLSQRCAASRQREPDRRAVGPPPSIRTTRLLI